MIETERNPRFFFDPTLTSPPGFVLYFLIVFIAMAEKVPTEISVIDENKKLFRIFPAFKSKNYRLYFSGQLVSLIGTWLQVVAQGWLVLQLTNSAFLIGLVAAIHALPTLIFSLFGGVIVDSFPKKRILIFTQSAAMLLAFALGTLTVLDIITVPHIMVLSFLLGIVNAIDGPARQSFVIELVGREGLSSAIALNSGIFNSARIIGPSIAGFLIAAIGTGGAFIVNAFSYVAVLIALLFMKISELPKKKAHNPFTAIKAGINYAFRHQIIQILLLFTAFSSMFGWSFTTILPVIAKNTFRLDASGLGMLYAASGLGALVATLLVSAFAKKYNPFAFIFGGNILFIISLLLFAFTTEFLFGLLFLFMSGLGLLTQFAMINTTIQHLVKDNYRGRVMSLYAMMFFGTSPFGSFQIGYLSEHFGTQFAMKVNATVLLLFCLALLLNSKKLFKQYNNYLEKDKEKRYSNIV